MFKTPWWLSLLALLAVMGTSAASGADFKVLHGHVPDVVARLNPVGKPAATSQMRLAIGLPLRDPAGLDAFLAQLYDPASPNYRQYLTPEQFADRFGPTEQDYEAVKQFALANGLAVVATHRNRLLVDVTGPVAAVEKALHITLHTYQHPTEARRFFAPDTEPTVASNLPVADIQGLSDYYRHHPRVKKMDMAKIISKDGSAPDGSGSYIGNDFRNAYVPSTALTGAGQMVGLLEFDGFYSNDIAAYATSAGGGRASIPIQTVLLDGYNGRPTPISNPLSGNLEVSLDIEMAMCLAPGLAKIISFEAGTNGLQNDVLNSMVTFGNTVKQLSCSWGWSGGPSTTTDAIFKNMQAAGQSFFNASGDSDAFTTGANSVNGVDSTAPNLGNAPSSSPYIIQVGGTTLTMNGTGGSYSSETVWNWGYDEDAGAYVGSSGGISSYYPMPSWQTNVSNMAGRGGSASSRNIPDVALTADNIYTTYGNGQSGGGTGGTSCAAPLWAGFMALVNQQAASEGRASAGFINPAIYTLAASAGYSTYFHDVTTGNNEWPSSPSLFSATTGYDLCTGLGTPNGTNLINALAGPADPLAVSPTTGYAFSGPHGGPFDPGSGVFQLTNSSGTSLNWSLSITSLWLKASLTNGILAAQASASPSVSLTAASSNLALGNYSSTVAFTDLVSHAVQRLPITLQIYQPLSVSPVKGFAADGPVGGPFTSGSQNFVLTNLGTGTINWSLVNTSSWLAVSATSGSLVGGGFTNVAAGLSSAANTLKAAVYNTSLIFTNPLGLVAAVPFTLSIGQPIVQNGGFEAGDFLDWILSGQTTSSTVVNGSPNSAYVHSGTYGAQLGPASALGYLAQNLTTAAGQNYILSLWLRNHTGGTPNEFQVQWDGATIFDQLNLTTTGWTNLQFLVTATGSITPLQFGFQNDPDYFGLDDIAVTPLVPVAFKSTVRSAGNFQLTWGASTGFVYQVEYKTNISQPNWINLGGATLAKTNTLTVTDTNAFKLSPQRYYRLQVVP